MADLVKIKIVYKIVRVCVHGHVHDCGQVSPEQLKILFSINVIVLSVKNWPISPLLGQFGI